MIAMEIYETQGLSLMVAVDNLYCIGTTMAPHTIVRVLPEQSTKTNLSPSSIIALMIRCEHGGPDEAQ